MKRYALFDVKCLRGIQHLSADSLTEAYQWCLSQGRKDFRIISRRRVHLNNTPGRELYLYTWRNKSLRKEFQVG